MENNTNLPVHIGIIMDGNGRWASKRNLPRTAGHVEGAKNFKKIVDLCYEKGIKVLSCYAFSTENWKRPEAEVKALMALFDTYLDDVRAYSKKNVRVMFLGDKAPFSENLRKKMISLENDSAEKDGMTLMLAMNYGGRDDIVHSAKQIAQMVKDGGISPDEIDENLFDSMLYTKDIPPVDLLIRPGGEYRISNYLLWQSAYAEFYFCDTLWPDFDKNELEKAIEAFSNRKRRFGGI